MLKNKQLYIYIAVFLSGLLSTIIICYLINQNKMVIDLSLHRPADSTIIATIDGQPVYLYEVESQLRYFQQGNINFNDLDQKVKELIVKKIAIQNLILKDALKAKTHKKAQDESIKNYASSQVKKQYLDQKAKESVTEEEIKKQYDLLLANIQDKEEYRVRHILTNSKTAIDQAKKQLHSLSFKETAKKFSIDKSTANNGGDLGYIVEGTTLPEFDNKIKKLKVNQISKPFKTELGWHIIQVTDKRKVKIDPYETAKEKIIDFLANQKGQSYIKELLYKDYIIEFSG